MPYPKNPATFVAAATREYLADEASEATFPYSPARATAVLAKRYAVDPRGDIVGKVAAVYYRENGTRSPLAIPVGKSGTPTPAAIAKAVRKARDARGRLARWEVLAYRLAAALGSDAIPSRASVESLYVRAGGDVDTSYVGRGTKAGAKAVRGDDAAAVLAGATSDDAGETVAP